ncbi:MAG: NADH-dependent flavin oxidoreductase [Desulfobulbus sp.]|nr:MAG: NADH-dependent flavin oxidoreductase [Desulfobulbus sp.]
MTANTLFTPFSLGNYTLKNRIGLAPMTRMSAGENGIPRQDVFDFLTRRARNGAAIVYTEAIVTDYESAQGYPGQARITTQPQIDAWKRVVEDIHNENSLAILQMFHCGRMAWPDVNPAHRSIAPSALAPTQDNPLTQAPYPTPEAMSAFDISHVISGFVETARGAFAAGFDGVEIHGAHGYLISQFLSAYSNTRTDDYGGSVANRFRFAREVIQAVKKITPAGKLLIFRISDWGIADMEVSLFANRQDYQETIKLLANEPVDAISVSTYAFDKDAYGSGQNMAQLTREVTDIPLIICGGIYDRATAEQALQDADIMLAGKSLLLNPNWVADIKENKPLTRFSSEEAGIAYTPEPLL